MTISGINNGVSINTNKSKLRKCFELWQDFSNNSRNLSCLFDEKRKNSLTSGIEHFWVLKLEHVNFYTDKQLSKLAKIIFAVNFFMHVWHRNSLDRLSLKILRCLIGFNQRNKLRLFLWFLITSGLNSSVGFTAVTHRISNYFLGGFCLNTFLFFIPHCALCILLQLFS